MFSQRLRNAAHVRQFLISDTGTSGWEVREEIDSEVVRLTRYFDWHRVERAQREFEREVLLLRERGWTEAASEP
jgi:hypothetical protein